VERDQIRGVCRSALLEDLIQSLILLILSFKIGLVRSCGVSRNLQPKDWCVQRIPTNLVLESWPEKVRAPSKSKARNSQIYFQLFQGSELPFPHIENEVWWSGLREMSMVSALRWGGSRLHTPQKNQCGVKCGARRENEDAKLLVDALPFPMKQVTRLHLGLKSWRRLETQSWACSFIVTLIDCSWFSQ
jgi:hypothetical protein